jgi:hypothetical protein
VRAPRTAPPPTFISEVGALAAAPARARAPARLGDVRDGRGRAANGPTQHESHLQRRNGRFPREGLLAWRAHRGSPGFVGCARQAKHQGREPPRHGMKRLAGAVGTHDTGAGVGHGPMLAAHLGHRLNCAQAARLTQVPQTRVQALHGCWRARVACFWLPAAQACLGGRRGGQTLLHSSALPRLLRCATVLIIAARHGAAGRRRVRCAGAKLAAARAKALHHAVLVGAAQCAWLPSWLLGRRACRHCCAAGRHRRA